MPSILTAAGNRKQRRQLEREIRKAHRKLTNPVFVRPSQRLLQRNEKKDPVAVIEPEISVQEHEDLDCEDSPIINSLPEFTVVIPVTCRAIHLEFEGIPDPSTLLIPKEHVLQFCRKKGINMWLESFSVVRVEPKTRGIISWDKDNREKHRIEPLAVVTVRAVLTRRGFDEKSFIHEEFNLEYSLEEVQKFIA